MNDKGFLLIQKTYAVRCLHCGFKGRATLGNEPIQIDGPDGPDWCPVCNHASLVGDRYQEKESANPQR